MNKKSILKAIFYMPLILYIQNSQMLCSEGGILATAAEEGLTAATDAAEEAAEEHVVDGRSAEEKAAEEKAAEEKAAAREAVAARAAVTRDGGETGRETAGGDATGEEEKPVISLSTDASTGAVSSGSSVDIDKLKTVLTTSLRNAYPDIDDAKIVQIVDSISGQLQKLLTDNLAERNTLIQSMLKELSRVNMSEVDYQKARNIVVDAITEYNLSVSADKGKIDELATMRVLDQIKDVLTQRLAQDQREAINKFENSVGYKAFSVVGTSIALGLVVALIYGLVKLAKTV